MIFKGFSSTIFFFFFFNFNITTQIDVSTRNKLRSLILLYTCKSKWRRWKINTFLSVSDAQGRTPGPIVHCVGSRKIGKSRKERGSSVYGYCIWIYVCHKWQERLSREECFTTAEHRIFPVIYGGLVDHKWICSSERHVPCVKTWFSWTRFANSSEHNSL